MVFNTGAALLDAIVLAVVSREQEGTYGYKITQDVRRVLDVSESTMYPVLRRLQKDECLEVYDMQFDGRNRRPPLDRVNAALSMTYTLLAHDCASALESVGLDAYVGFMHRDRPGRTSLALDLMEELRVIAAHAIDRCSQNGRSDWSVLKANIKNDLSGYLFKTTKRNPMILPVIMEI